LRRETGPPHFLNDGRAPLKFLLTIALALALVGCGAEPEHITSVLYQQEIEQLQAAGARYAAADKEQQDAMLKFYGAIRRLEEVGLKADYHYSTKKIERVYRPAQVEAVVVFFEAE
jgi:hypothetical protein